MDLKLLVIFLTVIYHFGYSLNITCEPLASNAGVIFIPKGTIIISSNTWVIAVEYPFSVLTDSLKQLRSSINAWEKSGTNTLGEESANHLWALFEEAEVAYHSLTSSSPIAVPDKYPSDNATHITSLVQPTTRGKRGIINFAGYLARILFGTATTKDFDRLRKKITFLSQNDQVLKHATNEHMTYIRKVKQYMDVEDRRISHTVGAISLLQNVVEQIVKGQGKFGGTSAIKHSTAISLYSQIISAIHYVHLRINELKSIRQQLERGYLDPLIIRPKVLKELLIQIKSTAMPPHTQYVVDPELIAGYYHWKIVTYLQDVKSMKCIINVPLMTEDDIYSIYHVIL